MSVGVRPRTHNSVGVHAHPYPIPQLKLKKKHTKKNTFLNNNASLLPVRTLRAVVFYPYSSFMLLKKTILNLYKDEDVSIGHKRRGFT